MKYLFFLIFLFILGCSNKPDLPSHSTSHKVIKTNSIMMHLEVDNLNDSNVIKLNDYYYYVNNMNKKDITLLYFKTGVYDKYTKYVKDPLFNSDATNMIEYYFISKESDSFNTKHLYRRIIDDSTIVIKTYP